MEEREKQERREEIAGWFVPFFLPDGQEPEDIRRQYIDIAFPIRAHNVKHGGIWTTLDTVDFSMGHYGTDSVVIVDAFDAIKALGLYGNLEAARWLAGHFSASGTDMEEAFLIFERQKGYLYSPQEMYDQLPETAKFDEVVL